MLRTSRFGDEGREFKSKSRTISKEIVKINQWHHALQTLPLFNKDYTLDVVQIMESTEEAWTTIEEVIKSSKDSHVVKVITPQVLTDFMNTVKDHLDNTLISHTMLQFAINYIQCDETYALTSNFFAALIKLRILAFYEEYFAHHEMVRKLREEIQHDVNKYSGSQVKVKGVKEKKEPKEKKKKKEKPAKEVKEKGGKKGKGGKDAKEKEQLAKKVRNTISIDKIPQKPLSLYDTVIESIEVQHVYFIICGFYDSTLIHALKDINVNVSAFIEFSPPNLQSRCVQNPDDKFEYHEEDETPAPAQTDMKDNFVGQAEPQSQFKISIELQDFWENWQTLKNNLTKLLPKDTCYIKYIITDKEQNSIFDELLVILHNISDLEICFKKYYEKVRYLNVEDEKIAQLHCMIKYNTLMDQIPSECITIPYLLDSLLKEVCAKADGYSEPHRQEVKKVLQKNVHGGTVFQVKKLLKKYDCSHYKSVQKVKIPRTISLSYGNVLYYTTGHLAAGSEVSAISLAMLKQTIPMKLFELIKSRNPQNLLLYNYVFAKWSNQLTNITMQQLMQTVYSFLFARGNFKKVLLNDANAKKSNTADHFFFGIKEKYKVDNAKRINIRLTPCNNPLEENGKKNIIKNTLIDILTSVNDSCQISADENYYPLVEELDTSTTIQMINTAYNYYKHFDYKYFAPSDVVLIRFHHNTNEYGTKEENKIINLGTTICFRDFCSFFFEHQTSWFVEQLEEQLEEDIVVKKAAEEEKKMAKEVELQNIKCTEDFTIPGSFKEAEKSKKTPTAGKNKAARGRKGKGKKEENIEEENNNKETAEDKNLKMEFSESKQKHINVRGSKSEYRKLSWLNFARNSVADTLQTKFMNNMPHKTINLAIPSQYSLYDPTKKYDFEIYNLGSKQFVLENNTARFISSDGISASMTKDCWVNKNVFYTFEISDEHTAVILHTHFKNQFVVNKPFYCHLNVVNGTTLVFAIPKEVKQMKAEEKKHIIEDEQFLSMWNYSYTKEISYRSENSDITRNTCDSSCDSVEYLKLAIRKQIPIFKIISSRLHKYNYVKRIKSHLAFPVGNVLRRVICKPKLFQRLTKHSKKYTAKCVPFSDFHNKKKPSPGFECKGTLSTGLQFQTKFDMSSKFYVKQKYITERKDISSIQDEAYRCCIRNGVIIKFMKDGSIKTLSPDKSNCHYQFGYFSSNTRHSSLKNALGKAKVKRISRIIPLHAYTSNLSLLEKKIRYICNKYKNHLIDISDNYHFESSRLEHRNKQKTYKLSKKLYTDSSNTIPILNQNVTTAEGDIINIKNNKVVEEKNKYPEVRHKDYLTHETILHREDGISWFLDKKGKTVTQFPDGSRISTWCSVLDENFLLKKRSVLDNNVKSNLLGITQSKYSQTDHGLEIRNRQSVKKSLLANKSKSMSRNILFSRSKIHHENSEEFVLIGMNYKFEHPNYATVYYFCEKDTIDIKIPDNIRLTVYPEGSYAVKTINDSVININNKEINFTVSPTNTSCLINLSHLFLEKPSVLENFLYIKDSTHKEFSIDNTGRVFKAFVPPQLEVQSKGSTMSESNNSKVKSVDKERLFVLKRNLSGQEYFRKPVPYNFAHTMKSVKEISESKAETNVLEQLVCTKIMSPLKKNYSEHLMMLYDVPVLATSTEQKCMDKLWKIHDLDINCFITKREPRYIFKRVIFNLPSNGIMQEIATSVIKCILDRNDNLPDLNVIRLYKEETEEHVKPVVECVEKDKVVEKYIPKRHTCKNLTSTYKQLIKNQKIPPYFKTVKGIMFTTIESCSENAMKIGEPEDTLITEAPPKIIKAKSIAQPTTNVKFNETISTKRLFSPEVPLLVNVSAPKPSPNEAYTRSTIKTPKLKDSIPHIQHEYPGKLEVPKDLTIHLKPDSKVHEIVLTAKGLKIITEKDTLDYPFREPTNRKSSETKHSIHKRESLARDNKLSTKVEVQKKASKGFVVAQKTSTTEKYVTKITTQLNELQKPESILLLHFAEGEKLNENIVVDLPDKLEGSFSNLPSWNNSNCEKMFHSPVVNEDPSCVNTQEDHTCSTTLCYCPPPSTDENICQICTCPLVYCSCDDTYPWYSTCALQNELNISEYISVLAWNTVITFEKDPKKLDALETALERVIQSVVEDTELMNEEEAVDLGKTITYILKNKRKQNDVIDQENAIYILTNIVKEIYKMNCFSSDNQTVLTKESSKELSDKITNVIIYSKQYINKEIQIINTAKYYLLESKITLQDVITIIKIVEEKINHFYTQKLPDTAINSPVLHSEYCKEIITWIEMVIDHIVDMSNCSICQSVTRHTDDGPVVIPGIYCSNINCSTKNNEVKSLEN